jgi:hypothetical protein
MLLKCFLAGLTVFILNSTAALAENVKSIAGVSFAVPDTWKETEPSSSMRAYQFELPGAGDVKPELVVFYFGEGQGGGVQQNIDRWKSQFTRVTQEEIEPRTVNDIPTHKVYVEGTYQQTAGPMMMPKGEPKENSALLGVVIEAPKGPVFLKMTGSKENMMAMMPEFDALMSSVKKAE